MAGAVAAGGDGNLEVAFVCLGGEGGTLHLDPMSSGDELRVAIQVRMGESKRSRIRLKLFNQCCEIAKEDLLADHLQKANDGLLEVQVMKQFDHVFPEYGHCAICTSPELAEIRGAELVVVFERLVALGMAPPKAAAASKRFAPQLKELAEMGFEDWVRAVELLERYNGRLLRVANLLSEAPAEESLSPQDRSPSPPSAPLPRPPPPQPEAQR
eukprot:s173_g2.t2